MVQAGSIRLRRNRRGAYHFGDLRHPHTPISKSIRKSDPDGWRTIVFVARCLMSVASGMFDTQARGSIRSDLATATVKTSQENVNIVNIVNTDLNH
jgi:hypothetical protein